MKAFEVELDHRADDQVFSVYRGEKLYHFNVTLLQRMHKVVGRDGFARITMDLTEAEYDLCVKHRGIEEPKVAALKGKQLREPGYGIIDDEGQFTIVDGHHRLVRRYRGGIRTMDFYVTNRTIWQHCLVEYPPEFEAILAEDIPERVMQPADIKSRVTLREED